LSASELRPPTADLAIDSLEISDGVMNMSPVSSTGIGELRPKNAGRRNPAGKNTANRRTARSSEPQSRIGANRDFKFDESTDTVGSVSGLDNLSDDNKDELAVVKSLQSTEAFVL
jgi:hypothetical protein